MFGRRGQNLKINRLYLNNFRIFRGEYEFDFSNKKLIIVYGQNGNGKSTIFDAIEWCITGELQRYKGSNERNKFYYIINNKEYKNNIAETTVLLELNEDSKIHTIKRVRKENTISGRRECYLVIDGKKYRETEGNKKIQDILIRSTGVNLDENYNILSNFKELFSATQLLSQNELNNFVSLKKPQERFEVMETILGVNKYGDDFRGYLKNVEKHIENMLNKDEPKVKEYEFIKNNLSKDILEIRTKIEEQEKYFSNIGQESENELIENIISLVGKDCLETELDINESHLINVDVQQKIKDIKKENEKVVLNYKDIELKLSKVEPFLKYDISNFEQSRKLIENNLNIVDGKYNRRDNNIDKYTNFIQELRSIKGYKNEFINESINIEKIEVKINNFLKKENEILNNSYSLEIKKEFKNLDIFESKYLNYYNTLIDIQKVLKYKQEQFNLEKILEEIKVVIENYNNLNKESELLKSEVSKYENDIKDITSKLSEVKHDSNKQLIYNIQQYLIKEEKVSQCPVCGTDFKIHSSFVENVKKQLEESTKNLDQIDKSRISIISNKSQVEAKLIAANNKINELKLEIVSKEDLKTKINIDLEELKTQIKSEYINLSKDDLEIEKDKYNYFIHQYKTHYEFIQKLKNMKNEKELLINEKTQKDTRIKAIKELLGTNKKYLEKNMSIIDEKIVKIEKYLILAKKSLQEFNEIKKKNKKELKDVIDKINQYNDEVKKVKLVIPEFLGTKEDYVKWNKYYSDMSSELEDKQSKIEELLRKIEGYLSRDKVSELKKSYEMKNKELNSQNECYQRYSERVEKYKTHIREIQNIKEQSKEIQSNLISSFMSKYSSVIDKLFFQITPHAFAQHIYLIPRNGNLYIIVSEESGIREKLLNLPDDELSKEVNASLTLSSAQSNILAVCIFIVMNMSQKWAELDLMGIDDPFQNMDDINVFSFIDTLSGMFGDKQVIISTHSSEFASLILNKAPLIEEEISFVQLNSYGVDGVEYELG